MNLYELSSKYEALLHYAQTTDFEDAEQMEAVRETLDTLNDSIEEKAENIAHVLKQLEYDEMVVNEEIKRLTAKKASLKNNHVRLKDYLKDTMEYVGKYKIKTPKFSINIQNNPPKLVVDDVDKIPKDYFVEQQPVLDRRSLLNDLKQNSEIAGAKIVQEKSLRIR